MLHVYEYGYEEAYYFLRVDLSYCSNRSSEVANNADLYTTRLKFRNKNIIAGTPVFFDHVQCSA